MVNATRRLLRRSGNRYIGLNSANVGYQAANAPELVQFGAPAQKVQASRSSSPGVAGRITPSNFSIVEQARLASEGVSPLAGVFPQQAMNFTSNQPQKVAQIPLGGKRRRHGSRRRKTRKSPHRK